MTDRAFDEKQGGDAKRVKRRWPTAAKWRIVEESHAEEANVSIVARRRGISPTLLFHWRKLAREGRLGADQDGGFAVAKIVPSAVTDERVGTVAGMRAPGAIEVVVEGGCVIVDASVDTAALTRVLAALRSAAAEVAR